MNPKTAQAITELGQRLWEQSERVRKYEQRRQARLENRDKLADRAYWVTVMRAEGDQEPVSAAFYPTHGGHGCDLMDLCLLSLAKIQARRVARFRNFQMELFGSVA